MRRVMVILSVAAVVATGLGAPGRPGTSTLAQTGTPQAGTAWERMPGAASDIAVGANGAVWVVGATPVDGGFAIHRWTGARWERVRGGAVEVAVDPEGRPWVVNDRGAIFRRK